MESHEGEDRPLLHLNATAEVESEYEVVDRLPARIAEGGWASLSGQKVCRDRADRWRREHSWDKDGKCIVCTSTVS